jgi:hypothetical protein
VIHHDLHAVLGPVQQPETAAAHPAAEGLDNAQRGADGHRGVEGIAALLEDLVTGRRRGRVRRRDGGDSGAVRRMQRGISDQQDDDDQAVEFSVHLGSHGGGSGFSPAAGRISLPAQHETRGAPGRG